MTQVAKASTVSATAAVATIFAHKFYSFLGGHIQGLHHPHCDRLLESSLCHHDPTGRLIFNFEQNCLET